MIFQYSQLRRFFELIKKHNTIVPLRDCGEEPCVIMRHDVDFDVQAAVDLADIEEEQGVLSSFFFLTTSSTYNIASLDNRQRLRELHSRGFEVGLHFDPLIYGDAEDEELHRNAKQESEIIATIIGEPVRSFSVHNPSVHGKYQNFGGFNNAYDQRFFAPHRYLADSCMTFRGKDPFEFFAHPVTEITQVLLHPLHYAETEQAYVEFFQQMVRQFSETLDQVASQNRTYKEERAGDLWSILLQNHRASSIST